MRFSQKWHFYCKNNFHWLWMHQIGIGVLDDYQEKARIYLDEYEVEVMNNKMFRERKNLLIANIINDCYEPELPVPSIVEIFTPLGKLRRYQENCRIYMDEYPEGTEVDLRVNFDTSLLIKRFTEKL